MRQARFPSRLLVALLGASLFGSCAAASTPVPPINAKDGVALHGYDPVAYFTAGRPTPGSDAHTQRFAGATYRFASAENLALFAADPQRYLPQYGGYCAYAMSLDRIADIDPDAWAIVDGKLYLNNNRAAHALWSFRKAGRIEAADRNWAAFPKAMEAP
jgi:YHS domain-containing protein